MWNRVQKTKESATKGIGDAINSMPAHVLFHDERNVLVASPEVDCGQWPAAPVQDTVDSDCGGKVQYRCAFAGPVLEDAGHARHGNAIGTFRAQIIPLDEPHCLTKLMSGKLRCVVRCHVVVHAEANNLRPADALVCSGLLECIISEPLPDLRPIVPGTVDAEDTCNVA